LVLLCVTTVLLPEYITELEKLAVGQVRDEPRVSILGFGVKGIPASYSRYVPGVYEEYEETLPPLE
jgi:hypothetical protein